MSGRSGRLGAGGLAACAALALASGCWSGSYAIVVRDDGTVSLSDAAAVDVAFVNDCGTVALGLAPDLVVEHLAFRPGEQEPSMGRLTAGAYGLYVRLRDERCRVFAAGCTPVRVDPGGQGRLEVTVTAETGLEGCLDSARPGALHCDRGLCTDSCEPDCDGRQCGPDGCDGVCPPGCGLWGVCDVEGRCRHEEGFVRISTGTFSMGAPEEEVGRTSFEPPHLVFLTRDILVLRTEMTDAAFRRLMLEQYGISYGPTIQGDDALPAATVSWHDAAACCNALTLREGGAPADLCYGCESTGALAGDSPLFRCAPADGSPYDCAGYRLPTEAEWEHAARAGIVEATPAGDLGSTAPCHDGLELWARYGGGSCCAGSHCAVGLLPPGSLRPNAWGLHDMLGNVAEWCHDSWLDDPTEAQSSSPSWAQDPWHWEPDGGQVVRGGHFESPAPETRHAFRSRADPDTMDPAIGFRPVRTAPR